MDGLCPNHFQGTQINDIVDVDNLLTLKSLLYHIDIVDGNIVGEFARQSLQKDKNTAQLLRYHNPIC